MTRRISGRWVILGIALFVGLVGLLLYLQLRPDPTLPIVTPDHPLGR